LKLTSKLLLVLNLALAIVLAMHVASVAGSNIRQNHVAAREEAAIPETRDHLSRAAAEYSAIQRERDNGYASGYAAVAANRGVYEERTLFAQGVAASAAEAGTQVAAVTAAKDEVSGVPDTLRSLVDSIGLGMNNAAKRYDDVRKQMGDELASLVNARASVAGVQEDYARIEYNLGLLSSDLRRKSETLSMYRWLRPDVQAEVGDNGPHMTAEVLSVTGSTLTLSKGSRHGIQLYQKFSILDGTGAVVAVANVTEVRNGSAEAEIRSLPNADRGKTPAAGHIAVPRQLNFSLDNPGIAGR